MKSIDKIVASKYPIRQTQCLWIDLSQDVPVMKVHTNGEWVAVGDSGSTENKVIEITHEDLKDLRDNGKLTPGQQYRIADYHCTTIQENTKSADHQFDIIVTADDKKTLNENARAIQHEGGERPYGGFKFDEGETGVFSTYTRRPSADCDYNGERYYAFSDSSQVIWFKTERVIGPTDVYHDDFGDKYLTMTASQIVEEGKSIIPIFGKDYFEGVNFAAWELKYCLDNDTNRFAWASILKFSTTSYGSYYVRDAELDSIVDGVIFYGWKDLGGDDNIYTKTLDIQINTLLVTTPGNEPLETDYIDNIISDEGKGVIYYMKDEWNNECPYDFKNIQFLRKLTNGNYDPEAGTDTWVYTFNWYAADGNCLDTSIVGNNGTLLNDEGKISGVYGNSIGTYYAYDDYSENPKSTTQLLNNNVFLYSFDYDGDLFYGCFSNTLRNGCYSNTFKSKCSLNTLGYHCSSNTFGDNCYSNTFGNNCYSNFLGESCNGNAFGNDCSYNTFESHCSSNTFGNNCSINIFGTRCESNTFGNNCYNNTFGNNVAINYCAYIALGDGVQYCKIYGLTTPTIESKLQNIRIAQGTSGNSANRLSISISTGNNYETYVGRNSSGTYVKKCLLDSNS